MKRSTFVTAENLPDLMAAFGQAVESAGVYRHDDDVKVSVIGEAGVGKSYIATKLAEGVLGPDMHTISHISLRDDMHDLILWSVHTDGEQEVIQYDEASKRFVDDDYHNFVLQERAKNPVPIRTFPGVTFIEHPDLDTEEDSDIIVRVRFSEIQKRDIARIRAEMLEEGANITVKKEELAEVAARGCEIEIETQGFRIDDAPLIEFFDDEMADSRPEATVPTYLLEDDEDLGDEQNLEHS